MPSYSYECEKCGREFSVFKRMSEVSQPERCPDCSGEAQRIFSLPKVEVFQPFFSEIEHRWITTSREEKRHDREHGLIDYRDTPFRARKIAEIKRKRKKPVYFCPR